MQVDIPHNLPRDEARRRIDSRLGDIGKFVPGGAAKVTSEWASDYQLNYEVGAMGQAISGKILIEEKQVQISVDLPFALAFVEPMIAPAIREKGEKLLSGPA